MIVPATLNIFFPFYFKEGSILTKSVGDKALKVLKVQHLDKVAYKPSKSNDAFYHHLALMQVRSEIHKGNLSKNTQIFVSRYI